MPSVQELLAVIDERDKKIVELRETMFKTLQDVDNKHNEVLDSFVLTDDLNNQIDKKDQTIRHLRNVIGESSERIKDIYLDFAIVLGQRIGVLHGYKVDNINVRIIIDGKIVVECLGDDSFIFRLTFNNYNEQLDYLVKLVEDQCKK